jgi:hypothetical protein
VLFCAVGKKRAQTLHPRAVPPPHTTRARGCTSSA